MLQTFKGKAPEIAGDAYVHETSVLIGEVKLSSGVSIWPYAVLRADLAPILIGELSNVQDGCVLHTADDLPVVIGERVTVGHNVTLHGCIIEDEVLIGMGAVVLDGAIIKRGAIVGAGAVVSPNSVVEEGMMVLGIPAKPIRSVKEVEALSNHKAPEHYYELACEMKRSKTISSTCI